MIYNYGFPVSPIQRQALQPTQTVPYAPIDYSQPAMTGQPLDLERLTQGGSVWDRLRAMGRDAPSTMAKAAKQGGMQQAGPQPQQMLGLLQMPQAQPLQMPQQQQFQVSPYMQNLMRMASGRYG